MLNMWHFEAIKTAVVQMV